MFSMFGITKNIQGELVMRDGRTYRRIHEELWRWDKTTDKLFTPNGEYVGTWKDYQVRLEVGP